MSTVHLAAAAPGVLGAQTVVRRPCRYLARATWSDQLVAESSAAVRVEEPDRPPTLYFPMTDVRVAAVHDDGRTLECPVKGRARLWTLPGTVETRPRGWTSRATTTVDGVDAAWSFCEPAPELGWLADYVAFDHDRVRVELVDAAPGADPRDVTVKRFPTWGDAADLVDVLDVRPESGDRFVGAPRADLDRPVVEGSQLLAQALVAAARRAPGRRPVSGHMVFFRVADAREPLTIVLDELSNGRTFTAIGAAVEQHGRRRAAGTFLLDATAPDLIRHEAAPPPCAGPYASAPYDMSVTGRDIRMVDDAYTDDPDAVAGPPVLDAWVRFRDVPDDPVVHAALLTQFTGHLSIAAALRPHEGIGQQQAHRSLSMGINAIAISLHSDIRADRWMRYHHLSTFAGDGMTHAECRVYDEAERLLASFTVDAMVRGFPVKGNAADDRTAI